MSISVKDANQVVQNISTENDAQANLVPVHAPASTVAGISTPVGPTAPLPVINTAGAPAVDGSGTITLGGAAQLLFSGATPANGFQVQNQSGAEVLWVNDLGAAGVNAGFQIAISGGLYTTPPGYRPGGPVSIYGATSAHAFTARKW